METKPIISVIMPVFNTPARILQLAIQSVNCQVALKREAIELIVVDDGSDNRETLDCLQGGLATYDIDRLETLPCNCGQSVARNRGVSVAKGEWLAFLDSDDQYFCSAMVTRLHSAIKTGSNFVYTAFIDLLYGGNTYKTLGPRDVVQSSDFDPRIGKEQIRYHLQRSNLTLPGSVLMKKDLFEKAGGFEPGLVCSEDWVLWRRVMDLDESSPWFVSDPTWYYVTFQDRTLGLNQSHQLSMPKIGDGFHLDTRHKLGSAGQYLDERARKRSLQWSDRSSVATSTGEAQDAR